MPIWLRDLWPTHSFDPCAIWENEKKKEEEEAEAAAADAAASASSGKDKRKGGGGGKGASKGAVKLTKREMIQEDNARKLVEEEMRKDIEKLKNATTGKSQRAMLYTLKLNTPYGRLNQLLEILSDAVESRDKKTAFDVLWAIEELPLYKEVIAEEESDSTKKPDSKKSGKKNKDSSKTDKKGGGGNINKKPKRSKAGQLVNDFRKVVKKGHVMKRQEDIIVFQLTEMADRLPPLSRFVHGWKLDEWQKRVLRVVDEKRSAIVCAPTSSGKTVISQYVTFALGSTGRVLFVVPTEPLVWQVAALFHKLLKGSVGLCMDYMHFRPDSQLRVIVGTPHSLETVLSKLRGPVGEEAVKKVDYAEMQGGFTFDYAIFDEVHSLDGEKGGSLQRLIQSLNCNFLALSATIGNAEQLRNWWEGVRGQQLNDVEAIEANEKPEGPERWPLGEQNRDPRVHLEEYSERFINLQRWVWSQDGFRPLHPLSAVSFDMLTPNWKDRHSLPFTPRDTYALWEACLNHFPAEDISDLEPHKFFSGSQRITLQAAKKYELTLCSRLEVLAKKFPSETKALLSKSIPDVVGHDTDVVAAVQDIKLKDLCPAIMFHLDSFHCLELFKELLLELESAQQKKYPNYLKELQEKAEELARLRAQAAKRRVQNAKEEEEEAKDMGDMSLENQQFVDTAAPHPEFVLSHSVNRLSSKEYEDIVSELAPSVNHGELKSPGHPFLRSLRRGFGIYIDDASFPKYRRIIQRLAQQGKLAFVFSDHSLAYGVNMPFRSCCFCSSMDQMLTPLLAQQMSGRAGRRGLDTQGNLLYMNMKWPRIQHLMIGSIPAIRGDDPRYPTVYLQHILSEMAPAEPYPPVGHSRNSLYSCYVDEPMAKRIAGNQTLAQFIDGVHDDVPYLMQSKRVMQALGYVNSQGELQVPRTLCVAMFELREYIPESIALAGLMDTFIEYFVDGKGPDYGESVSAQIEFCGLLLLIVDRVPVLESPSGTDTSLGGHSYFTKDPSRASRLAVFLNRLEMHQQKLTGLPDEKKMRVRVPVHDPVDGRLFHVFNMNSFQPLGSISSYDRFLLTQRLRKLGSILMVLHNVLHLEHPYDSLELILRKVFVRVKYLRKVFVRVKYIIGDSVSAASRVEDSLGGIGEAAADG